MIEYKRSKIADKYFSIEIFECPIDVIMFASTLGLKNVTIENYRHHRDPGSLEVLIRNDDRTIKPGVKLLVMDFQISKPEFISLKDIWDKQGCYAIFHESDKIKFKVTDLNGFSRYKALDNFGWNLEIAIPDSSSDGWGQIVSPDQNLIERIENYIQDIQ